ncbi:MAG: hypothetical protein NTW29_00750 [Bacteroidetes bacterium]|nr:hypothetical protein [Bacteroidota bacterium]
MNLPAGLPAALHNVPQSLSTIQLPSAILFSQAYVFPRKLFFVLLLLLNLYLHGYKFSDGYKIPDQAATYFQSFTIKSRRAGLSGGDIVANEIKTGLLIGQIKCS